MKDKIIITIICLMLLLININTLTNKTKSMSSAIAIDINSGRVLYEKNKSEKHLIASITKILTAIVVIENTKDLNKEVEVKEEVLKMYGTNIYIEMNEKIKIIDLLYGLILRSGNDAAVTLAVNTAESEEKFVELMNKKAKDIGMKNSSFENVHGLDDNDTKNISTAEDMAILSKYAYKNEIYREIFSKKNYKCKSNLKSYEWINRNKLLFTYDKCIGGKNGYTPKAGKTLVTVDTNDNLIITVVTLDDNNQYNTHKNISEEIFKKYKNYTIVDKESFKIKNNKYAGKIYIKDSFKYPLLEEEKDNVETITEFYSNKKNNNQVGNIKIYLEKKEVGNVPIYQEKEKSQSTKKTLTQKFTYLFESLKKFILG